MKHAALALVALAACTALDVQAETYTVGTITSADPPSLHYYARPPFLGLIQEDSFWFEIKDPLMKVATRVKNPYAWPYIKMELHGAMGLVEATDTFDHESGLTNNLAAGFYNLDVYLERGSAHLPGLYEIWIDAAPIPEPETWGLMLSGLGPIVWAVRRRSKA